MLLFIETKKYVYMVFQKKFTYFVVKLKIDSLLSYPVSIISHFVSTIDDAVKK